MAIIAIVVKKSEVIPKSLNPPGWCCEAISKKICPNIMHTCVCVLACVCVCVCVYKSTYFCSYLWCNEHAPVMRVWGQRRAESGLSNLFDENERKQCAVNGIEKKHSTRNKHAIDFRQRSRQIVQMLC